MKIFPLKPKSNFDILSNFLKIVSKDHIKPKDTPKPNKMQGFNVNNRGYLA